MLTVRMVRARGRRDFLPPAFSPTIAPFSTLKLAPRNKNLQTLLPALAVLATAFLFDAAPLHAQISPSPNSLSSDPACNSLTTAQVVEQLTLRNKQRAQDLMAFESRRTYRLIYGGISEPHEAGMVVSVSYREPSTKDFTIETSTGSKIILDRVFDRMIKSEKEAFLPENRAKSAFNPSNYDFTPLGTERNPDGVNCVLQITPRRKERFLYRGKIWVDAKDFAVTRIQAEPVTTPSFWTEKSDFDLVYEKVGEFWLPARNSSETWLRFGGRAHLTIDYRDYRITDQNLQNAAAASVMPGDFHISPALSANVTRSH
jgi:hypothetical protein